MPLKTLVKVGSITNLSDARYCAGMGVEMLGFNVVQGHESFIDAKKYQEIRGWVTGPAVVAEIYNLNNGSLSEIAENYAPEYFELAVKDLSILPLEISTPLILKVDEDTFRNQQSVINARKNQIAHIIIDQSETSSEFITTISSQFSVLLAPEKDADINSVLDTFQVKGIALNGSQEIKPGLKDYDHLAEVLELLEEE
ncbi:MAG TPA: N-(5'-phosphoribosyl)anthranilate isomerase [Cyclobacteriaceae bacterium]